jgi:5,10-methylenetetrahydrofolate reductase
VDLLKLVAKLQQAGEIPTSTQLWAAGNPMAEPDAAWLEAKADAGATTVLTQPPIAWERFFAWMADAERRGVLERCRVCAGVPVITSSKGLRFWLRLCGVRADGALP